MEETPSYAIKLPQFEGPFDLLLFFIERDELHIHDIPIAQITTDFLDYIHAMQSLNMELASEFIYVAATLMRIKARTLLPRPELNEDGEEIDLKADLVQKLVIYKQFKEICESLRSMESKRHLQYRRANIAFDIHQASIYAQNGEELTSLDLYKLLRVYERQMQQFVQRQEAPRHTVIQYPYTIEKQKEMIQSLIKINKQMDFSAIKKQSENKVHFVYNFLAILEMLQQQLVDIEIGLGYNMFTVTDKSKSS
jgi:segregation and condensation protein A